MYASKQLSRKLKLFLLYSVQKCMRTVNVKELKSTERPDKIQMNIILLMLVFCEPPSPSISQ